MQPECKKLTRRSTNRKSILEIELRYKINISRHKKSPKNGAFFIYTTVIISEYQYPLRPSNDREKLGS